MPTEFEQSTAEASGSILYNKNVLFLDNAEGTDRWVDSTNAGNGGSVYNTAGTFFEGEGLVVDTDDGTPAEDDWTKTYRYFCYPRGNTVYVRLRWCVATKAYVKAAIARLIMKNGTKEYNAAVKWSPNTPKVEIETAAGAWSEVAGMDGGVINNMWALLDFSINMSSLVYGTVLHNGVSVDCSSIDLYEVGADTDRAAQILFELTAAGAHRAELRVDNIFIGETENP